MLSVIKRVISSKVGWTVAVVHFVAVIYEFYNLGAAANYCDQTSRAAGWIWLAGRGIHWFNETILLQFLLLANMPALVVAESLTRAIVPANWCDSTESWIVAIAAVIFASIQWYVIGYVIEGAFRFNRESMDADSPQTETQSNKNRERS